MTAAIIRPDGTVMTATRDLDLACRALPAYAPAGPDRHPTAETADARPLSASRRGPHDASLTSPPPTRTPGHGLPAPP